MAPGNLIKADGGSWKGDMNGEKKDGSAFGYPRDGGGSMKFPKVEASCEKLRFPFCSFRSSNG